MISQYLAAYQSTSITQITVLVQWIWSCLGRPTQKNHAFKQPLNHTEIGFLLQDVMLHKLSQGPHFETVSKPKF